MDAAKKVHYHLVTGHVYFHPKDDTEQVTSALLNAISTTDDGKITVRELGRAQQVLQMQLFQRAGVDSVVVVDVIIGSVSHLGEMTPVEFYGEEAAKTATVN